MKLIDVDTSYIVGTDNAVINEDRENTISELGIVYSVDKHQRHRCDQGL